MSSRRVFLRTLLGIPDANERTTPPDDNYRLWLRDKNKSYDEWIKPSTLVTPAANSIGLTELDSPFYRGDLLVEPFIGFYQYDTDQPVSSSWGTPSGYSQNITIPRAGYYDYSISIGGYIKYQLSSSSGGNGYMLIYVRPYIPDGAFAGGGSSQYQRLVFLEQTVAPGETINPGCGGSASFNGTVHFATSGAKLIGVQARYFYTGYIQSIDAANLTEASYGLVER